MNTQPLIIRLLGRQDYSHTWQAMETFTRNRNPDTLDELWLLQHPPVFTQGVSGKAEHLLNPGNIPVIQSNRGGQITYHGPGQIVAYVLFNIRRQGIGIRKLVTHLENTIIDLVANWQIQAQARADAPGVYIDDAKIASIGLRVSHGCSYHGLSLNVDMNLEPFSRINPCGYPGLRVSSLKEQGVTDSLEHIQSQLIKAITHQMGYTAQHISTSKDSQS